MVRGGDEKGYGKKKKMMNIESVKKIRFKEIETIREIKFTYHYN